MLYLLPCFLFYKAMQKAHYHPQGRWRNIKPNLVDVFLVLCPIINIIFYASVVSDGWKSNEYKKESNAEWFFKPKKSYNG